MRKIDRKLLEAAKSGDTEALQVALKGGADVNAQDRNGWTSLMWAAGNGHENCVLMLIEAKTDINAQDHYKWTALMGAAVHGEEICTWLLLDAGADPLIKDEWGKTAADAARRTRHDALADAIEACVACGAPCGYYDVPIRDTKYKKFSLRDPFWATKGGFCPECLKLAGVSE